MHEENEESENVVNELPKKVLYKFRYGTKAPIDEYYYDFQFDAEPIDFDHRALREEQPEPHKTFKYPEEYTLFLIKPGAMLYKDQIIKRVYEEGFITLKEKTIWLSCEEISEFYDEHYGKPWFPKFIMKMATGPIHIMVLAKDNAVEDLKALMGHKRVSIARKERPYSLRALYGLKGDSATNAVHGSENKEAAAREVRFFYPQVLIEPPLPVQRCVDYVQEHGNLFLFSVHWTTVRLATGHKAFDSTDHEILFKILQSYNVF
ncbi:nucleoside diphosphate kinase isoform X2 [Halyomorpha halys]|uniref:nucleoside diphosphate kinase isoform X2 n=1 Tax=Halyomorpha halys TaxID=286706 RepID=UPI0006D5191E|nr:nucleoside diphosphate kinase homolog 5-like isoform X2 [Halyomorpha halys]